MDDRLEVAQRRRVGKDDPPEGRPIELTVRPPQRRTEARIDRLDLGGAGGEDQPCLVVGVDDADARPARPASGRLSTSRNRSGR